MQKKQFEILINSNINNVYNKMLGINDIKTYEEWTKIFNPTSTYIGSWEKGSKIYFIGVDENGEKGGMVSIIDENIPNKFVSIKHIGILVGSKEITEGEDVESWAGGLENYTFEEVNNKTKVTVELDVTDDHIDYFEKTYPLALSKLKEISEKI